MDDTDAAVLREMLRDRVLFWGTLDPRLKAESIARRIGLAPTTVRARVRGWQDEGFLRRYEVLPHPAHFGLEVAFTSLRVDEPREKPDVLERLGLIAEVLAVLDHVGPWVGIAIVRQGDAHQERVRRIMAGMPGVGEVQACVPLPTPPCPHRMTPLDWRITRALRMAPLGSLGAAAAEVGVSRKTLARRYGELVRSRALWFVAVVDFTRWRGGVGRFIVSAKEPSRVRGRVLAVLKRRPALLDLERLPPPAGSPIVADAFLALKSSGQVEDIQRDLLAVDGVDEVEALLPRTYDVRATWADERMPPPGMERGA